jgi:hypothetical protein
MSSALRIAQRRPGDGDGVAVMSHPAQQCLHHGFVAEESLPFVINQIGRNNRGVAVIAFLHQLEKSVRLFGLEI